LLETREGLVLQNNQAHNGNAMKISSAQLTRIFLVLLAINASATVRYVDLNSTNATPPFNDWSIAATNIQDAIDAAVAGDMVLVTNGVYATGGRVVFGSMTNRVVINKAVTVQSVNGPAATIIAGLPGTGAFPSTGYRCVYLTNGAGLTGFTLTNGATLSSGDLVKQQSGAAVWCESVSATISNCVLTHSYANCFGGGAYQGTLNNCLITNNTAFIDGGGTYNATLNNCTISGNQLIQGFGGGGVYAGVANNCIISSNSAWSGSGAQMAVLNNCILSGNGLVLSGSVYGSGGGSYSNILHNCLLIYNRAVTGGGACQSVLVNCTVVSNTASVDGGGVNGGSATNCIVYYNSSPGGFNFSSNSLNFCDTLPLPVSGFGNITNKPVFVNLPSGDFHLQSNSPCINSGNNASVSSSIDLDGNPRIKGGMVDIGAYEYQTPRSVLSYAWAQQYGLATDGSADFADLDRDGLNNWQEWIAGTIPTYPGSVLAMNSPSNVASGVNVSWQSVTNRNYFLQRSTDLLAQPAFSVLQSNLVGQAGTTTYTDTTATNSGPYFYRVGVQ
jgi:hypothetical protein